MIRARARVRVDACCRYVYGRELQVSPSPIDQPSSRVARRDYIAAGAASPVSRHSPENKSKNSKFAFRIPLPMTTCSVEQH